MQNKPICIIVSFLRKITLKIQKTILTNSINKIIEQIFKIIQSAIFYIKIRNIQTKIMFPMIKHQQKCKETLSLVRFFRLYKSFKMMIYNMPPIINTTIIN